MLSVVFLPTRKTCAHANEHGYSWLSAHSKRPHLSGCVSTDNALSFSSSPAIKVATAHETLKTRAHHDSHAFLHTRLLLGDDLTDGAHVRVQPSDDDTRRKKQRQVVDGERAEIVGVDGIVAQRNPRHRQAVVSGCFARYSKHGVLRGVLLSGSNLASENTVSN